MFHLLLTKVFFFVVASFYYVKYIHVYKEMQNMVKYHVKRREGTIGRSLLKEVSVFECLSLN